MEDSILARIKANHSIAAEVLNNLIMEDEIFLHITTETCDQIENGFWESVDDPDGLWDACFGDITPDYIEVDGCTAPSGMGYNATVRFDYEGRFISAKVTPLGNRSEESQAARAGMSSDEAVEMLSRCYLHDFDINGEEPDWDEILPL